MSGTEPLAPEPSPEPSIAFSVEELVALSRLTGSPLPILGPNPLSHVRLAEREAVLDTATRSLRARNAVVGSHDAPMVPDAVRGLLDIVSGAAVRADLIVSGPTPFHLRYHAIPYASVEHQIDHGLHRFTPFATEDLLARMARSSELTRRPSIDVAGFSVPYGAVADARAAIADGRVDDAVKLLADGGAPSESANAFTAALSHGDAVVSVRLTHKTGPTTISGGELSWLDGGVAGLWLVPTIDQPFAHFGDPEGAGHDGSGPDGSGPDGDIDQELAATEVAITPTDADAIAAELFSFVPTAG